MRDFETFMVEGAFNDMVIQMALREIDSEPLARALVDQGEKVRSMVLRNMSPRAVAFLKNDIRDLAEASPESIRAGQELFAGLVSKHAKLFAEGGAASRVDDAMPPAIDLSSRDATITTFCALAEFTRQHGLLPLDDIVGGIDNHLMRKGVMMLIEGWDPLLLRSILERYKESYLRAQEIGFDLVIEGIDSLAAKDTSLVTEQKLRALVAGL